MRGVWLALAWAAMAMPARGEAGAAAGPVFEVDYSNPGLSPSHWVLTLYPDGSGHFWSERGSVAGDAARGAGQGAGQDVAQGIEAPNVDRDIRVSAEFAGRVFETARQHQALGVRHRRGTQESSGLARLSWRLAAGIPGWVRGEAGCPAVAPRQQPLDRRPLQPGNPQRPGARVAHWTANRGRVRPITVACSSADLISEEI